MNTQQTDISDQLRGRGLRVTAPRRAVLAWLLDYPHATVDQIHLGVRNQLGTISKQAVYDVLSACLEADLVRQIKPAGHAARFERRTGDNHHHLVCRSCGEIADTDCHTGVAPCVNPVTHDGFAIDEAEIVFWGLCQHCQQEHTT